MTNKIPKQSRLSANFKIINRNSKYIYIIIGALLAIFLLPIFISISYGIGNYYPFILLPFTPENILTYFSTTAGSLGLILIGYYSFKINDKLIKIEESSNKPYIRIPNIFFNTKILNSKFARNPVRIESDESDADGRVIYYGAHFSIRNMSNVIISNIFLDDFSLIIGKHHIDRTINKSIKVDLLPNEDYILSIYIEHPRSWGFDNFMQFGITVSNGISSTKYFALALLHPDKSAYENIQVCFFE